VNNLDFFVFGVARSGTTALTNAFNLHPDVFCGVECFHPALDHSKLDIPVDFTNLDIVGERKANINSELMAKKESSSIFGNKFPRYYLHVDNVVGKSSGAAPIGIHRESLGFIPSWNDRAEVGTGWNKGRGGVAGIIEQFIFFSAILKARSDFKIFSYDELFFNDLGMIEKVYASVDAPILSEVIEKYKTTTFQNKAVMNKVRIFSDVEKFALEKLKLDEIDLLFKMNSGEYFSSYSEKIKKAFDISLLSFYDILPELLDNAGEIGRAYIKTQIRDYKLSDKDISYAVSNILEAQSRAT
tara:strand:+ start:4407 stop:5303 length:897 start_codon:yes stop_codon:yes gene_type:complete